MTSRENSVTTWILNKSEAIWSCSPEKKPLGDILLYSTLMWGRNNRYLLILFTCVSSVVVTLLLRTRNLHVTSGLFARYQKSFSMLTGVCDVVYISNRRMVNKLTALFTKPRDSRFAWYYSWKAPIGLNGPWLERTPEYRTGSRLHGFVNRAVTNRQLAGMPEYLLNFPQF